jgi:hypothetical protein
MYRRYDSDVCSRRGTLKKLFRQEELQHVTDPERIIKWIPSAKPGEDFTHPVCVKCDLDMTLTCASPVPYSDPARLERHFACGCGAKVTIEVPAAEADDITGDAVPRDARREGCK